MRITVYDVLEYLTAGMSEEEILSDFPDLTARDIRACLIEGDLSNYSSPKLFLREFEKIIIEFMRVLKPNKYCAILVGDTRKRRHFVPLAYMVMDLFLENGFILKEDIIKTQHNCKSTPYWRRGETDFFLIMHEHLFVFRKPDINENLSDFKWSIKY